MWLTSAALLLNIALQWNGFHKFAKLQQDATNWRRKMMILFYFY
ncbi:unnamed protein product [Acanthoscelides obtectus]|uniref:Uncharacterized protein n=1 Tax=Acanthoscelides obtectus TaxID=200917 RepID=A0A9P0JKR4_ACAOB|nr:unnamed protein product [Acanthoscelides obtectus]CAK1678547.1 hypothetical protein AOBTE_LOCUS31950 [Acanthoscelides obtectus]